MKTSFLRYYGSLLLLLGGILAGTLLGSLYGPRIAVIKPAGDIFLNLLFTAVVPQVFFAISAAVAGMDASRESSRLVHTTLLVFISTVLIAALLTIIGIRFFPVTQDIRGITSAPGAPAESIGEQLVKMVTVPEFYALLSRSNMLPLIIISVLTGVAASRQPVFRSFLQSGNEVMKQLMRLIMKLAPFGLGAYFAWQVGTMGTGLFKTYSQALLIGHGISLGYYGVMFSVYAFIAGGIPAIGRYWKYNLVPSLTALGTCSSIATLPANMQAASKMGIPPVAGDMAIPLGAAVHKEGSAIAAVIKIAVALAIVHQPLSGAHHLFIAVLLAILISIIEGGIPNGGYVGQLLIVNAYQLPPEVLPVLIIIGSLLDPIATLLNATGDTVAAMLIARFSRLQNTR